MEVRYCGGYEGKVYRGVNRGVCRFCRQACLLMYALNVDRRYYIVPPLRGADRETIENYPCPQNITYIQYIDVSGCLLGPPLYHLPGNVILVCDSWLCLYVVTEDGRHGYSFK